MQEVQFLINDRPPVILPDPPTPTLIYSNLLSDKVKNEEQRRRRSTLTPHEMANLRREPRRVTCNHCRRKVNSVAKTDYAMESYFWCSFLFCCGGILFSWAPFVFSDMKQTTHTCPECTNILGSYKPRYQTRTKVLLGLLTLFCLSLVTTAVLIWSGVIITPFLDFNT